MRRLCAAHGGLSSPLIPLLSHPMGEEREIILGRFTPELLSCIPSAVAQGHDGTIGVFESRLREEFYSAVHFDTF